MILNRGRPPPSLQSKRERPQSRSLPPKKAAEPIPSLSRVPQRKERSAVAFRNLKTQNMYASKKKTIARTVRAKEKGLVQAVGLEPTRPCEGTSGF